MATLSIKQLTTGIQSGFAHRISSVNQYNYLNDDADVDFFSTQVTYNVTATKTKKDFPSLALGPSLDFLAKVDDPFLNIFAQSSINPNNFALLYSNDDFADNTMLLEKFDYYTGVYSGLDQKESLAAPTVINRGKLLYQASLKSGSGFLGLSLNEGTGDNIPYPVSVSNEEAWVSYDIASGTNYKKIASYALDFLDGYNIENGIISGISGSKGPRITSTGVDIRSAYSTYCIALGDLLNCPDSKEPQPLIVCYTGLDAPTGNNYINWLSGQLRNLENDPIPDYRVNPPNYNLQTQSNGLLFNFWSGSLEFNDFYSGDKLFFDLYNFDYTGEFKKYHVVDPAYPTTGFALRFPNDFTNIDELVDELNNRLSGVSYPMWYPYDCLSGSGSDPVYVEGPIARFWKRDLEPEESGHNNLIDFYSFRNSSGHSIYLEYAERPLAAEESNKKIKYLSPSYVRLEGSNDEIDWVTLDERTNISWDGITPTIVSKTGQPQDDPNILSTFDPFANTGVLSEVEQDAPELPKTQQLANYRQTIVQKVPLGCSPAIFSRQITFIGLSGVTDPVGVLEQYPSGVCNEPSESDSGEGGEDGPLNDITGQKPVFEYEFVRTGWNLYDNGYFGTNPLTGQEFNYLRIYLSGFSSVRDDYEYFVDKFYVPNINFFGGETGEYFELTGAKECWIGADFTGQVKGNVPVTITGTITGDVRLIDEGVRRLEGMLVSGDISGLAEGDWVQFNNESGRLVSSVGSGVINENITGIQAFCTGIEDEFFYDPITQQVSFQKEFCSQITGSGALSGEYIRIKDYVVNRELALGGFLNPTQFVDITTGVQFTGIIQGEIVAQGLTGLFDLSVNLTGEAEFGMVSVSECFTGLVPILKYGEPTGFINSTGAIQYNNPINFDLIEINGIQIRYNDDTDNFVAPDFYSSFDSLLDIINSNPLAFLVSGSSDVDTIYLSSLVSGEQGNNITLFGAGSTGNLSFFDNASMIGGEDLYRLISGTGEYNTCVNIEVPLTGFYSSNGGSGFITGDISTYLGERNFFDVWNIATGSLPNIVGFKEENLVDGEDYFSQISGPQVGVAPSNFRIFLNYDNIFDEPLISDVVKLTLRDNNFTGISGNNEIEFIITGLR
jgi:hypothetical protein